MLSVFLDLIDTFIGLYLFLRIWDIIIQFLIPDYLDVLPPRGGHFDPNEVTVDLPLPV